jgi:hypothetical protein
MSEKASTATEREQSEPSAVLERLSWQLARRDDERVAQGLYAGEAIEEMHQLSEAGLLDEFLVFLEQIGMMAELEQMELAGVQRVVVPTIQFVLLSLRHPSSSGESR